MFLSLKSGKSASQLLSLLSPFSEGIVHVQCRHIGSKSVSRKTLIENPIPAIIIIIIIIVVVVVVVAFSLTF